MTKGEIALQLTLAMIEKGNYQLDFSSNESLGKCVADMYNTICKTIDNRGRADD